MSSIELESETLRIKGWLPIGLQGWGFGFQLSTEAVEFKFEKALEGLQ